MATMSKKIAQEQPVNVVGPTLSRRQFLKSGGVFVVGFSFVGPKLLRADAAKPAAMKNSLDPSLPRLRRGKIGIVLAGGAISGGAFKAGGLPLILPGWVCLDTSACGSGWLTCLEVGADEYFQANQAGSSRTGRLE